MEDDNEIDKETGLTMKVLRSCRAADAYRMNNPIHLGNGEDFIPRLSTDPINEVKPRLSTKPGV